MKKILLILSVTSIALFSSCGSDDTTEEIINEIIFDGTTLVGQNGIAVDVGTNENHYEFNFAISDGNIIYNSSSSSFQYSNSSEFIYSFGAAALGNQFRTGIFEFRDVIDATPNGNFFFSGTFVDITNSDQFSVTDGTITISGTSPDYTLEFDLTLTGSRAMTGAFVGTFEIE